MVLEKQDSGISLSTTDGNESPTSHSRTTDVVTMTTSLDHLHLANGNCNHHFHHYHHGNDNHHHRHDGLPNGNHSALMGSPSAPPWSPEEGIHFNNFVPGQRHSTAFDFQDHLQKVLDEEASQAHVPLHKTVCCALCR